VLPGWAPADAISGVVLGLLLAASISTWAVLLHQAFRLRRVQHDLRLSRALFWQAPDWQQALQVLNDTEKEGLLAHLAEASQAPLAGTLAVNTSVTAQTERALRDALHQASARLHHGHTFLASVAASAPFVGLLGTVWGIRRAMLGLDASALVGLDRLAAPVGEALLMTALGLGVAIPALIAHNLLSRQARVLEAELEGFAHDLLALRAPAQA
jgi:biopolymer transport protein ExbB